MRNPNMGRPVKNKYKVPKAQWSQWSNQARRVFNRMYYTLRPLMQFVFLHPDQLPANRKHWQTTRWNVAWEAACAVDGTSHASKVVSRSKPWSE